MEFIDSEESKLLNLLSVKFNSKFYPKGSYLYRQSDTPEYLYHIKSGLVGLTRLSEAGTESLLRLFKSDQFFGHRSLFSDEEYHGNSKCLEDCELVRIPKAEALNFFELHPKSYFYLARSLAKELRRAELRSVTVSEGDVIQRVASTLILFKSLKPNHLWTRKEIADYCASRTPTVITALGKLETQGAIEQNKREIKIINLKLLESLI